MYTGLSMDEGENHIRWMSLDSRLRALCMMLRGCVSLIILIGDYGEK